MITQWVLCRYYKIILSKIIYLSQGWATCWTNSLILLKNTYFVGHIDFDELQWRVENKSLKVLISDKWKFMFGSRAGYKILFNWNLCFEKFVFNSSVQLFQTHTYLYIFLLLNVLTISCFLQKKSINFWYMVIFVKNFPYNLWITNFSCQNYQNQ